MTLTDPVDPPKLEYKANAGEQCTSKYSGEYLKIFLEIVKHYDVVTLSTRDTYPLMISTPDFDFILAPRVDTD